MKRGTEGEFCVERGTEGEMCVERVSFVLRGVRGRVVCEEGDRG